VPALVPDSSSDALSGGRITGYVLGGLGAGSLIAGAYLGGVAVAKREASDKDCPGGLCTPDGFRTYEEGRRAATAANVTIGAGLAALGVAVIIVLSTGGSRPSNTASSLGSPGPRALARSRR